MKKRAFNEFSLENITGRVDARPAGYRRREPVAPTEENWNSNIIKTPADLYYTIVYNTSQMTSAGGAAWSGIGSIPTI